MNCGRPPSPMRVTTQKKLYTQHLKTVVQPNVYIGLFRVDRAVPPRIARVLTRICCTSLLAVGNKTEGFSKPCASLQEQFCAIERKEKLQKINVPLVHTSCVSSKEEEKLIR